MAIEDTSCGSSIVPPLICGLDEAGCGPLAGPVVAGCVILDEGFPIDILDDSKRMSEKKRAMARLLIINNACYGLGEVDAETIDKINILRARLLAMKKAFIDMLQRLPSWLASHGLQYSTDINTAGEGAFLQHIEAIADGTFCPDIPCTVRCEPKADGKYPPVMAASIIAKEERDTIMKKMDLIYPMYGYARHKGYPTKEHIKILHEIGPSPIQRLTYKYR